MTGIVTYFTIAPFLVIVIAAFRPAIRLLYVGFYHP